MNSVPASPSLERVPPHAWAVPLVVALASVTGAAVLMLSWRPELPSRLAIHWGTDGRPNGFATLAGQVGTTAALGLLFPALMLLVGAAVRQLRQMAGVASGMAVFVTLLSVMSTAHQRGVADAASAPDVGRDLWVSLAAGVVTGSLTWLVVRRRGPLPSAHGGVPAGFPVLSGAEGQRLAWTHPVRASRGAAVAMGVIAAATAVGAVVIGFLGTWWSGCFMLLATGVVLVASGTFWATVTIDHRGISARGMGVRWLHVPLSTIESAQVERSISPLGDFGGWGLRGSIGGTRGLVTSEGPGLRVHRAGQCDVVITVDDAERAAAVLNTLVDQQRTR